MGIADWPQIDAPEYWDRALLAGLVGPHGKRYQTSPAFRSSIDHLRALLPAMVMGIAANAEQADKLAQLYTERLIRGEVTTDELERMWNEADRGPSPPGG